MHAVLVCRVGRHFDFPALQQLLEEFLGIYNAITLSPVAVKSKDVSAGIISVGGPFIANVPQPGIIEYRSRIGMEVIEVDTGLIPVR